MEEIFREQLHEFFISPEAIAQALVEGQETIAEREELVRVLTEEEIRIRREMRKVYDLHMADKISQDGFGEAYRPLEGRLAEVRREIPSLTGELDYLKIQLISSDQVVAGAGDLYEHWADLTPDEKLGIVEAIVERIEVGEDTVSIVLYYQPPKGVSPAGPGRGPDYSGGGTRERDTPHPSSRRNRDKLAKNPDGLSVITE